jgi:peptide/nickel transport system permease protein
MRAYLLRRLLIMIPTFFGISLIVFLVLNLAPGRPGAQSDGDVASTARGEQTQDSYRLFREQFDLDKPVLINTRPWLTTAEVRHDLEVAAELVPAPIGERIAVQDRLGDLGAYAVPHLMAVLGAAEREQQGRLRDTAVFVLWQSAPRRLVDAFNPTPTDAVRAYNDDVARERSRLARLRYPFHAAEADKRAVIAAWHEWYAGAKGRYEYTSSDKLRILLTDTRFARYWSNLLRLDFGVSLTTREPVLSTLLSKLRYSVSLSLVSLALAYLIAIPLGVLSAVRKDTPIDRVTTVALFMLHSLPSFFVATVLLIAFSEASAWQALRVFPTGGFQSTDFAELTVLGKLGDVLWHLALPITCLTYGSLAALSRYMRTGLLEVLGADYIRTARAKGLPERVVIGKHALRNSLLPIITLLANLLPAVVGGSVVIEYIFGIPGIGQWTIDSIHRRDYNVIMGVQLVTTLLVLAGMLLADIGYALADPRIRYR